MSTATLEQSSHASLPSTNEIGASANAVNLLETIRESCRVALADLGQSSLLIGRKAGEVVGGIIKDYKVTGYPVDNTTATPRLGHSQVLYCWLTGVDTPHAAQKMKEMLAAFGTVTAKGDATRAARYVSGINLLKENLKKIAQANFDPYQGGRFLEVGEEKVKKVSGAAKPASVQITGDMSNETCEQVAASIVRAKGTEGVASVILGLVEAGVTGEAIEAAYAAAVDAVAAKLAAHDVAVKAQASARAEKIAQLEAAQAKYEKQLSELRAQTA